MSAGKRIYQPGLDKLFVYGIFLAQDRREAYNMHYPRYATVRNYLTVGDHIVQAHKVQDAGLALTGLVVRILPNATTHESVSETWARLDALESGYDRTIITTTNGEQAYMYVAPESE